MTLITNFGNLPFARGTFGAVRLEPDGFLLSGAASLEIEFPPAVQKFEVCSYSVGTASSAFRLFPDRVFEDRVLLPISRFTTYGSSLATKAEMEALNGRPITAASSASPRTNLLSAQSAPFEFFEEYQCVMYEKDLSSDTSQFPESCKLCFPELVRRALEVRRDLTAFEMCIFERDIGLLLGIERQKQMLGGTIDPEAPDIDLAPPLNQAACGTYYAKILPLWQEAQLNCPLNTVLLTFMLGFERKAQLLGLTNGFTCKASLADNLANVCSGARECLREIKTCCFLGHKGYEKQQEISGVLNQSELAGANCFPQGEDDPDVAAALETCLTNTWVGTLYVREYAYETEKTDNTEIVQGVDDYFQGAVYQSFETPTFGSGKVINLQILGDASLQLRHKITSRLDKLCSKGARVTEERVLTTDTVGYKRGAAGTLSALFGSYNAIIQLRPAQKTYQIDFAGGGLDNAVVKELDLSHSASCDGGAPIDQVIHSETRPASLSIFPSVFNAIVRQLPDPLTEIKGTYTARDIDVTPHTAITINWDFHPLPHR